MKIRIVLAICLLPLLAPAQIFPRHLKEDKLLGKVKTLTIITNDETREMYMYDAKGNQSEQWFFKPMGVLIYRQKAVYNEKGQVLEETKFDKGIAPVTKYVYGYDKKGMKIGRSLFSENNSLLEKYIYQYDSAKRMTDSIQVDPNSGIIKKFSWQYDKKGRLISFIHTGNAGDTLVTFENTYDPLGRLSAQRFFDHGVLKGENLFTYKQKEEERRMYGVNGRLISVTTLDSNKKVRGVIYFTPKGETESKVVYTYDQSGNMLGEIKSDSLDNVATGLFYKYDSSNNKTEVTRFFKLEKLITMSWQYEYDKMGNWIRRVAFIDGVPHETIKREIEYY